MYEKILLKLKAQRGTTSNVSDRSLEDLAKSLVTVITSDSILDVADLSAAIASIDGNINNYTADVIRKNKEAEDAKMAKKAKEEAAKKSAKDTENTGTDETPAWAKAILEQNKLFAQELTSLKTEKVVSTRSESLKKTLDGLPEYYTKPILTSFSKANFETEEDFEQYRADVEKQRDAFKQAAKEQGLNTMFPKSHVKIPEVTGETPELAKARDIINQQKINQQKK